MTWKLSELAVDGLPAEDFRCPLCGQEKLRLSATVALGVEVRMTKDFVLVAAEQPELQDGDPVEEYAPELSAFCWGCHHDFGPVQRAEDGDVLLEVEGS